MLPDNQADPKKTKPIKYRLQISIISVALGLLIVHGATALECQALVYSVEQQQPTKYGRGLLWRIESLDGHESYLFGTIHVSDPRVTALSNRVVETLHTSERFIVEVVLGVDAIATMSKAMVFDGDETLADYLDADLYALTTRLLARQGVAADFARKLKPWAAFTMLSVPPGQTGLPLDMVLMTIAERNGIEILGLESIEEQIALFSTLTIADQTELLTQTVCHYDEIQAEIETLIGYYLDQDLDAVMQMAGRSRSAAEERLMDTVLWQRNHRMVTRMLAYLESGRAFIAVGSLHLPGLGGILDLLTKHGYVVTRIE